MSQTIWQGEGHIVTRYLPGDPEPDAALASTASGKWYKNGRGWQHELALTDMGDLTWDELLEAFGAVYVWEKDPNTSGHVTRSSDVSSIPAEPNTEEQ